MIKNGIKSAWQTFVVLGAVLFSTAQAELALNMPKGVTEFSRDVYHLHMIVLWICIVIGVLVFGAMIYSIIKHRKSKGHKPAQFTHSTKAEVIWTTIPIIILIVMAFPATRVLIKMEDPQDMDMTIKITGYQWKWRYDYLDEGFGFLSTLDRKSNLARQPGSGIDPETIPNYLLEVDNPLVVPVNTKIRFLLTADDVIHSWWVPELGWKRDAIPGFINQAWTEILEPGTYRGQCAELCGKDHGFMPVVVKAVSKEDYKKWVAMMKGAEVQQAKLDEKTWPKEELMARGQEIFERQCASCHQKNGQGMPPAFPSLVGSQMVKGALKDMIHTVKFGRPGTAMSAFGNILSDSDLAAVMTYVRNQFGQQNDVVQPQDVAAINQS